MNRATFLKRLGLGFLAGLFARQASATTDLAMGAPDTADDTSSWTWSDNDTGNWYWYDSAGQIIQTTYTGNSNLPWDAA